jgi:hypothetical protein
MPVTQSRGSVVRLQSCAVFLALYALGGVATVSAQGGHCPQPPMPVLISPGPNEIVTSQFVGLTWGYNVTLHYAVTLAVQGETPATVPMTGGGQAFVGPLQYEKTYDWSVTAIAYQGCEMNPAPSGPAVGSFKTPQRIPSPTGNLAFGGVEINTTATRTLTIDNTGWSPLAVSDISYPAGFSGDWPGGTIAAGGSQTVTVTFAPTAETGYGGTITISGNHTSGTNTVAVSGMGTAPPPVRVLWRNAATGQNMGWQLNGTTVVHSPALPTIADTNWEVQGGGDFDANGTTDVIWRNRSTGQNIAWLMDVGTVTLAAFLPTIADTNWEIKGVGDFSGDGKADVILRNKATGQHVAWLMNGAQVAFSQFLPTIASTNWNISGVGDFSGDGKADVILRNAANGMNVAWLMNGAQVAFSAFLPTIADTNWEIKAVGDFSGDGKADVILRNKVNGQDVGWLMDGTVVSFANFLVTIADTNWDIKVSGDLNGDGRADIVWRNKVTGQNIGWLMNGLTIQSAAFLDTIADVNWDIVGP